MSALAALELTREQQKADIERRKKVAIDKLAARMAATAARTAALWLGLRLRRRARLRRSSVIGPPAPRLPPITRRASPANVVKPAKQRGVIAVSISNLFSPKVREYRPHLLSHLTR